MKICHRMHFAHKTIILLTVVVATLVLIGCTASSPAPTLAITTAPSSSSAPLTQTAAPTTTSPGTPSPIISSPSTAPAPTSTPKPTIPAAVFTPTATPFKPTSAQMELMKYVLELINKDRTSDPYLLSPVELGFNAAAQKHAQDMIDNHYQAAHWGTDGLKPYMRYTQEGGLNFDRENSCYVEASDKLDVKQELQLFEQSMVSDDAASNWSHLDTIVNKWNKKVNLGIAFTDNAVALVQDFEGDYLEYFQPPTLAGNILSLSGRFKIDNVLLNNVTITFDDLPQPISPSDLTNNQDYHHYGLGPQIGLILPPPPPGQEYKDFPANGVKASQLER